MYSCDVCDETKTENDGNEATGFYTKTFVSGIYN